MIFDAIILHNKFLMLWRGRLPLWWTAPREAFTFLLRDALLLPEPHQRSGKLLLLFLSQCFEHLGCVQVTSMRVCGSVGAFFRERDRDEWIRFRLNGLCIEQQCVSQLCMRSQ